MISDTLQHARTLLATRGWCTGAPGKLEGIEYTLSDYDELRSCDTYCTAGALSVASGSPESLARFEAEPAIQFLADFIRPRLQADFTSCGRTLPVAGMSPYEVIWRWNDNSDGKTEVLSTIDAAINAALEQGK